MYFNHCFEQKSVLLTTFILVAAAVVTFLFPEVWYPQENAWHLSAKRAIPGIKGGTVRTDLESGQWDIICCHGSSFFCGGTGSGR